LFYGSSEFVKESAVLNISASLCSCHCVSSGKLVERPAGAFALSHLE